MDMRDFGDNIGGVKTAWIILASEAIGWPDLAGINTSITSAQLAAMEEFPIFPHRNGYNQPVSIGDQGATFDKGFSAGIPSDNDDIQDFIFKYFAKEVLLVMQDHDERYWLLFDQDNPGLAAANFSGGTDPTDGKNHAFTVGAIQEYPRKKLTLVP